MALSGTFTQYPVGQFGLYCEWSGVQNAINNTTTITLKIYLRHRAINVAQKSGCLWSIDVESGTFTAPAVSSSTTAYANTLLTTQTATVTHSSSGTASITMSATYSFNGTYEGTPIALIEAETTVTLDNIDRSAPVVSLAITSVTATSVSFNAYGSPACDVWSYRLTDSSSWQQFSTTNTTAVSKTVTGLTAGTTYSISIRARRASNRVYANSAATTLRTIGGSSLTSASSVVADSASPTVVLGWNVENTSYTHTVTAKVGNTTVATWTSLTASTTGASTKTLAFNSTQRTALLNAMSNSTTATVTYTLTTYSGSTAIGSSIVNGNAYINASSPTFSNFTITDTNSTVVALIGTADTYVQSKSTLSIACTAATAKNGASIVSYKAEIGTKSVVSSATTISFGSIPTSGNVAVKVTATDSRGLSASVTKYITVLPYAAVAIDEWSIHRQNAVEADIDISFAGSYSKLTVNGADKNSISSAVIEWKLPTDSSYTHSSNVTSNLTISGNTFSFTTVTPLTMSADSAWYVRITVTDALGSSSVYYTLPKATPLMAFRSARVGVNTNDPQSALDVNGDIRMNGINVIGNRGSITDLTANLNNYTTQGLYFFVWGGLPTSNFPVSNAGWLTVFTNTYDGRIMQSYDVVVSPFTEYIRVYDGTAWSAWYKRTATL